MNKVIKPWDFGFLTNIEPKDHHDPSLIDVYRAAEDRGHFTLDDRIEGRVLDVLQYPERHVHTADGWDLCCGYGWDRYQYRSIVDAHVKMGLRRPTQ